MGLCKKQNLAPTPWPLVPALVLEIVLAVLPFKKDGGGVAGGQC